MSIISKARENRLAFVKMRNETTDAVASKCQTLFPILKYDNSLINAGTRINWNGVIKKASIDLWDTEENNPDNAPTLWEDINYKDGYRIIPDVITTTTMFSKDEYGWWEDSIYASLIDNNVWTPDQNASGWQLLENE